MTFDTRAPLAIQASRTINVGRGSGAESQPTDPVQGLIFGADWSNQDDWAPEYAGQHYRYIGDQGRDPTANSFRDGEPFNAAENLPGNFDFYYTAEKWHPEGNENLNDPPEPNKQPVAQISSLHGNRLDPVNGKTFIMYTESYGGPSQWGADAVLTKDLGAEYPELWVEFWIRFQPGFQWESIVTDGGSSTMKLFRCRRHSGITTDNRFSFFGADSRSGSPVFIGDLKVWRSGGRSIMRQRPIFRGYTHPDDYGTENDRYLLPGYNDIQETSIFQGGASSLEWDETFGNNDWHKINYYLKMDSFPGANDGVFEFWLNDIMEQRITDIPWRTSGDPETLGWNECSIGGNMNNVWADESLKEEQWYQVDELRVYSSKPSGG